MDILFVLLKGHRCDLACNPAEWFPLSYVPSNRPLNLFLTIDINATKVFYILFGAGGGK